MRRRLVAACLVLAVSIAGCGGGRGRRGPDRHAGQTPSHAPPIKRPVRLTRVASTPEALVTAETENRVVIVDLRTGAVLRHVALAAGGRVQYVDGDVDQAVAASPAAGTVSVLDGPRWRVTRVLHGFGAPHIVALSPDGDHAFVTDDARGTLSVIRLTDDRVTATLHVGTGAHHLAASPDQHRVWVALGESAHAIVVIDTSNIDKPAVVGRFDPGFAAHDLAFSLDGRRVWVTSSAGPDAAVFSAHSHRLLFRVPVGAPPQHVAFLGGSAYLTSGYGSTLERVAAASGSVIRRVRAPYGSFELSTMTGFVVTSSLLDGEVAVFTPALRLLHVRRVAPETRDVSVVRVVP